MVSGDMLPSLGRLLIVLVILLAIAFGAGMAFGQVEREPAVDGRVEQPDDKPAKPKFVGTVPEPQSAAATTITLAMAVVDGVQADQIDLGELPPPRTANVTAASVAYREAVATIEAVQVEASRLLARIAEIRAVQVAIAAVQADVDPLTVRLLDFAAAALTSAASVDLVVADAQIESVATRYGVSTAEAESIVLTWRAAAAEYNLAMAAAAIVEAQARSPSSIRVQPSAVGPLSALVAATLTESDRWLDELGRMPGDARPLPAWFVAHNDRFAGGQSVADLEASAYPIQAIRMSLTRPDPELVAYMERATDRRFVVIADAIGVPTVEALRLPNVIAIVVGHYYAADPEQYRPIGFANQTAALARVLHATTDTPILLAVPWAEMDTYESGRKWLSEVGPVDVDGYAIFHLVWFSGLEGKTAAVVRERLGLPNKPIVLLDFVGVPHDRPERAAAMWAAKRDSFIASMRAGGWFGMIVAPHWRTSRGVWGDLLMTLDEGQRYTP